MHVHHVSCSLPMCHTGYIYQQDTSGIHVSWNLHRDTSRYKITIHVYGRNTFRVHDGIHVSQMHPERHVSEMQDTCGIHVGYMYPERQSRYMLDTLGIHARYMQDTCISNASREMYLICRRHAGDMRDTCGDTCRIHLSSEAITIHTGYIRDSCEIHAKYMRDTYLGCQGGNVSMSS